MKNIYLKNYIFMNYEKIKKDGENFLKFFNKKIQEAEKPKPSMYTCKICGKGMETNSLLCSHKCYKAFYEQYSK